MYQEITKDEYRGHFTNIKFDPFLPTDIEMINSVISKYYKYYRQKYPSSDDIHIIIHPLSGRKLEYLFDSDKWLYDIDKIMDEWFLVRDQINDKYYKCDQLSGLLNLLESKMPKMKHIKTFESIAPRRKERPSKETLDKIQTELEDFLLDELDTYELTDQDEDVNGGKSLKEMPSYVESRRVRYVFSIKFKTPFIKSAESLSKRLSTWDNDYNFTLKSIECQSSSYWSERSVSIEPEREQTFTNIKITFDL